MLTVSDTNERWSVAQGDCAEWLRGLPDGGVDLVVTSPPYESQRLYLEGGEDLGIAREGEAWVSWMRCVVRECVRVCRGLVAVVCEGRQKDWAYSATPFLLLADLVREGVAARHPAAYHRRSTPGSGHDAWANCWEPVLLFTKGGRLPWSLPTACGLPPKFAPGGDCTNRTKGGERAAKRAYRPPDLANPGNVAEATYTASEVNAMLGVAEDIVRCKVGGGHMGHRAAEENEAPFPESLVERFILTFCPPGGVVLDPFAGSGTTLAAAVRLGRRGIGCDIRASQVRLARERLADVQPPLPGMEPAYLHPEVAAAMERGDEAEGEGEVTA